MTIRKYRESDREIIKQVTADTFAVASIDHNIEDMFGFPGGTNWVQRKLRDIDADCDANPDGVLVAEEGGDVIGYITSRLNDFSKIGWIPNMAVRADWQGKGVGRKLLISALDYLRAHGMELCKIETLEQNEIGRHLYPAVGFQEVARQLHMVMPLRRKE